MRLICMIAIAAAAASCALPADNGAGARPSGAGVAAALSPPHAACAAYAALRMREAGAALPTPGPLRIEGAEEHFRRADALGFSGGLRLLQNGRVRISRAYGFADHARRTPMSEGAVFDTGSVSKQFTAAAILRLEELGRLRTSDPIGHLLPDVPEDKRGITIHQLLTHEAGFPHSMGRLDRRPSRDAAVALILGAELIHPPGTRYSYSNAGYALLAALVDRLSGTGHEAFLRSELWLPLGMTETGMVLPQWRTAQIADGLEFLGPVPVRVDEEWTETGASWLSRGAAGISSTMPDLTRWAEALRTGAILSDASRRKLFWPHVRMNTRAILYYGYGWSIGAAQDGSCVIAHNGGAGIHYDVLTLLPAQGAVVATFNTQQRTPWSVGSNFVESLTPVLTGAPPMLPDTTAAAAPKGLAGTYILASGERIRVVSDGSRLKVPMDNAAALRLFAPWPEASPEIVASLGDRSGMIAEMTSGIAAGNYAPLLARLPANIAAEAETEFWRGYWPRLVARLGPFARAETVGTVVANDAPRTIARLVFERGSTVVAFVHGADGKTFIDTVASSFYPEAYLAPVANGAFQVFYPTTRRVIPVTFSGDRITIGSGAAAAGGRRASD